MIETFKQWFLEIRQQAIDTKKQKAQAKGDESKWRHEIWASPQKNKDIKTRFAIEGDARGFKARPSHLTNAGEWLYDFVWREFDDENNLKRVVLTMEIEVSDYHFRYDFNKLLQADSEYKIMVFQVKTPTEIEEVFDSLQRSVDAYQSKVTCHYLLVGWCTSLNEFSFRDFQVNVN
ncbi:hypothetical protein MHM98_04785 [Psychrobium sp. MM17-31]|uniref:hypothetical protein n=1 Tax=Psychrobium sp. MM17-31 TaxID=2917758 RepID=UPI001EF5204A|nr:hypothetical protein [Psychrobium sp. MM17-31]MCG7530673.1 hypothetical protein [Psychrobium sp. MM17-31]